MYIISAVLEKTQSKVALFDKEYKLISKNDGMSADLSKLCLDIISENGIKSNDVDYIGIAVDSSFGCPCCVAADVEKNTGVKCVAAPLMSAKALGEAYVNDVPSLFMLKVDEIVECGIVIDKKLFDGMNHLGGRIAHTVIDFGGFECTCGRKGCFEAYANNAGFKRIAAEAGVANADSITHSELYAMSTSEAETAKKLYVDYLASGITNIINLFQPNELVLDGPFTKAGDALMNPMMEIVLREQYSRNMPNKCNIRFTNNDDDTALIGAALLAR